MKKYSHQLFEMLDNLFIMVCVVLLGKVFVWKLRPFKSFCFEFFTCSHYCNFFSQVSGFDVQTPASESLCSLIFPPYLFPYLGVFEHLLAHLFCTSGSRF